MRDSAFPVCWAIAGAAACTSSPAAVNIESAFPGSRICIFLLEPEARGHCHPPPPARPRNLAECESVHRCIDGREGDDSEDIVGGDAQGERARFLDLECLVQRQAPRYLSRPLDNI